MMGILEFRVLLILVGLLSTGLFIFGLKNLLTVNQFIVGPQMKRSLKYLNQKTKGKAVTDKDLARARSRERKERTYINAANRMGVTTPYMASQNYTQLGLLLTFVVAVGSFVGLKLVGSTGILFEGLMNFAFTLLVTIILTFVAFQLFARPWMAVKLKNKEANKAINEEILLLLSIMKNGKEDNIRKIFETFSRSSKILKVDIQILLQELNIYGLQDALTRFSDRLNNPIATQFSIAVKAVADSPVEQRGQALSLVERDILETMQKIRMKESAKMTRIMGFVIVGSFAGLVLIFMSKTIGEVAVSLKELI